MSGTNAKNGEQVAKAIADWVSWKQRGCRPTGYVWTGKQLAVFEIKPTAEMCVARMAHPKKPRKVKA